MHLKANIGKNLKAIVRSRNAVGNWCDYCIFVIVANCTMKLKILIIFISVFITGKLSYSSIPGELPGILENIVNAVKIGNSKALAQYFSNTVEISLPGKEGAFSKMQAEMIIKDFFQKNAPTGFIVEQKGNSSGGAQFIIGTYKSNNKVFKTYILLKPFDGQLLIQQLQFEIDS
jgi:hypothetical protein